MSKFMIKSSDSYNDKNYEIVRGELKQSDNWLVYSYKSKLGDCEVKYSPRRVIVSRKGEVPAVIDIDLDKNTDFFYATKEIRKKFTVVGENIEKDEKKGKLEFSYKIYDNGIEINKITISIKNY